MALLYRIRPVLERFLKRYRLFYSNLNNKNPEDTEDVVESAALLQISEFRFFHLAYAQWFGQTIADRKMERIFVSYIFDSLVPFWVRHLARKVLHLDKRGILDPAAFDIKRRQVTPEMRVRGGLCIIFVLMILVLFCFLVANYIPVQ